MEPFFDAYRDVKPFLITDGQRAHPGARAVGRGPRAVRRHHQVHPVRLLHHVLPGVLVRGQYVGPAAIVNAHRFIFDSRDEGAEERLEILNSTGGRLALPHHLQLHRGLPARHPGHQGDPRGQARADLPRLTGARRGSTAGQPALRRAVRRHGPRRCRLGADSPVALTRHGACIRALARALVPAASSCPRAPLRTPSLWP